MSPQFVDYDADGQMDIVTGVFEGVPYLVRGGKDRWKEPERFVDKAGNTIKLSAFWNYDDKEWQNATNHLPDGEEGPEHHLISALVMDIDGDGDRDLLVGAKEGPLYVRRNEGKSEAPSYSTINEPLMAGGKAFNVPGGLTTPRLVDWDADGAEDLVCGSFNGSVYLYRNTAQSGPASFAAPVMLTSAGSNPASGPVAPDEGAYPEVVDYDGDGDLDLLVGAYSSWRPEERKLTNDEEMLADALEERISRANEQIQRMQVELSEQLEGLSEEEQGVKVDEFFDSPDYKVTRERLAMMQEELELLRPRKKRASFVWLYRRS